MMKPTFMILAFLLFFTTEVTGADNESVKFIFPPAGLTFNYMDTVNVSYISRYPKPVLYTFCTKANSKKPLKKLVQSVPPKNSTSLVLLGWPDVISCYFDLRPSDSEGNATSSHWFKVLSQARPTPIIVGEDQNSTIVPTAPSNTATITAAPASDGMSSGTKISIGVGVAVGVVLIAAAILAMFLLQRRRKAKSQATGQLLDVDGENVKSEFGDRKIGQLVPMQPMPLEMKAKDQPGQTQERHELSSETTFEMGNERPIRELSADTGLHLAAPGRFSWERGQIG